MSFWLRAASLPDRPPMAVNLLSIDVIFLGGHRGAVRSVQQFWGLRACARSAGAFRSAVGLVRLCRGGASPARPLMRPRGVLFAASNGGAAQRTAVERRTANASEARHAAEDKIGGVRLTDKGAAGARRAQTGACAEEQNSQRSSSWTPPATPDQSGTPPHSCAELQSGFLAVSRFVRVDSPLSSQRWAVPQLRILLTTALRRAK